MVPELPVGVDAEELALLAQVGGGLPLGDEVERYSLRLHVGYLLLTNRIVYFHGLSSTWCTAVSPLTEISRILYLRVELKANSTPICPDH